MPIGKALSRIVPRPIAMDHWQSIYVGYLMGWDLGKLLQITTIRGGRLDKT